MATHLTLTKIINLMLQIKRCLVRHQTSLPLVKCQRQFDFSRKIVVRNNPVPILFSKKSLTSVLRMIQILTISLELIKNNKFITKRNLYYQLIKYYQYYDLIDDDLLIICDSLKLERSQLNIIASSKLQLFWFSQRKADKSKEINIELSYKKFNSEQRDANEENYLKNKEQQVNEFEIKQTNHSVIQKQHIRLVPHQIFKIPNCPKLQVSILYPAQSLNLNQDKINFLIMQKQSIFEILSESLSYKLPSKSKNWFLINSKGYPDMTALQFVNQVFRISRNNSNINFYYIGDYDVYGIDIMLNYAIGNQFYQGLWTKMKWFIQFDQLIQLLDNSNYGFKNKFYDSEYRKLSTQNKKKCKQILAREYLQIQKTTNQENLSNQLEQKISTNELFMERTANWRKVLELMYQNEHQCEVESFFKNMLYPFDLIQLMIQKQLYL